MTFVVSEKDGPHGLLLVITDKEILGKKFEEGKVELDLTKKFYEGKERNKEEVRELISKARDLHLTGKEAVAVGVEMGLVNSERILFVKGMPHAEVVKGDQ
jgi:uncharacterized protein